MRESSKVTNLIKKSRLRLEVLSIVFIGLLVYGLSRRFDLLEKTVDFAHRHEAWELDELLVVCVALFFVLVMIGIKRIAELSEFRRKLTKRNMDLKSALMNLKQSKQTIHEREEHIRLLLNSTTEAIFGLDLEGCFTFCNCACIEILGYAKEEDLLGKKLHDLIHHTRADGTLYPAEECKLHSSFLRRRSIRSDNETFWRSNGTPFPAVVRSSPVIVDGLAVGAMVTFLDISRQKEAEQTLNLREREYKTLLENSPAVIIRYDTDLRRRYVNPAWEKIFGLSSEQVLNRSPEEISSAPKLMVSAYMAKLREVMETGVTQTLKFPWTTVQGEDLFLEYVFAPEFGEDGQVVSLLATGQDVTDRHRAEISLQRSLNFVESLLAQSPVGVRVFDGITGDCIRANEGAADISGGTIGALHKQNFREINSWHETGLASMAEKVLADGKERTVETDLSTTFGNALTVRYMLSRFFTEDRPHLLVFGQDISEQTRTAKEKKHLEEQILHAQKLESLGVLAGGIAHNFNNNLAIMLGNLDLALLDLSSSSQVAPLLGNVKTAVLRSRDLVQKLLTYSRKESRVKEFIQPVSVVEETISLLRSSIPASVNLRLSIAPEARGATINADASQIQEALLNLCSNAVHAMSEKGDLEISLATAELQQRDLPDLGAQSPGNYICLSVADTGSGIKKATMEKIFDPFFTTKAVNVGTGMGLATVQGIMELHDGLTKVDSVPGEKTTFQLFFPVSEGPPENLPVPRSCDNNPPKGKERILLVDDEELLLKIGKKILTLAGYEVTAVTGSMEALEVFKSNLGHFDLVISDQTMPGMTGEELLNELLTIRPGLPTMLCSGYSNKIDEAKAIGLGLGAFLMKPVSRTELLNKTRQILDSVTD